MKQDEQKLRKIIHIDMDAFFASIEQRDQPRLRNKPLVVGGSPWSRGVVATCSYEARPYGIHSAMSSYEAYRRCPEAIFIKGNMEKYREVSREIMAIFHDCTDLVEPLSLDEAYLDVTENHWNMSSATLAAKEIRRRIYQKTGLTASAGVSYNKFLAKTASDYDKPDGLTVITPDRADAFVKTLSIGDFRGVGRVTKRKFDSLGIETGEDLQQLSEARLVELFHKQGHVFYRQARGIDERPVNPERERKSLGKETTLSQDLLLVQDMLPVIEELLDQVLARLQKDGIRAKCIVLKIKFADFQQITRRSTLEHPSNDRAELLEALRLLLEEGASGGDPVRLLGVTASEFYGPGEVTGGRGKIYKTVNYEQLRLF